MISLAVAAVGGVLMVTGSVLSDRKESENSGALIALTGVVLMWAPLIWRWLT